MSIILRSVIPSLWQKRTLTLTAFSKAVFIILHRKHCTHACNRKSSYITSTQLGSSECIEESREHKLSCQQEAGLVCSGKLKRYRHHSCPFASAHPNRAAWQGSNKLICFYRVSSNSFYFSIWCFHIRH